MFERKFANAKCRVGGKCAPKKQNWFLAVIENELFPGHLPEQPAAPHREHRIEPEEMNQALEATELPGAGRSMVRVRSMQQSWGLCTGSLYRRHRRGMWMRLQERGGVNQDLAGQREA